MSVAKTIIKAAGCAALGLLVASPAVAYDWGGSKWPINPGESVPYVVSRVLSADIPDAMCLEGVRLGYDAWTALTCSYMAWDYQGRTDNTAWGAGDNQNVSSWREDNWDDSAVALAIAATQFGGFGGGISDCDVKFNGTDHSWQHFMPGGGGGGATDVASVSAHEIGHCNGFGHSDVAGATMWPSTGPGDLSGRSLSADDIAALCDTYPSGGAVPEPDMDPVPPIGNQDFGEDCSAENCQEGLFCLNDGRDLFCSRTCEVNDECGEGYYCAQLSGGGGACARGEDPMRDRAGFGEDCSEGRQCQQGLSCVNDDGLVYCTGPCLNDMCPGGFFCAELQGGNNICARGEGAPGDLPGAGQPCTNRGLCARGLFCIRDTLNRDEATGEVVPYCTAPCDAGGNCDDGFRCIDLPPSGTACQLVPSAGDRAVGDPCFVNPERPFDPPSCGDGLLCVEYEIVDQMVVEPGYCTKECTPDDCCPTGWGCAELTPAYGQCQEGSQDSPRFACDDGAGGAGGGGDLDAGPPGGDVGPGVDDDDDGGEGGCTAAPGRRSLPWGLLFCGFALLGLARRRR